MNKIVSIKTYSIFGSNDDSDYIHLIDLKKQLSLKYPDIWEDKNILSSLEIFYSDNKIKYFIFCQPISDKQWTDYSDTIYCNERGEKLETKLGIVISIFITHSYMFDSPDQMYEAYINFIKELEDTKS